MTNAAKEAGKEMMSFSEDNPLLAWGIGGLAAAGGIWLFTKVSNFLTTKFPSLATKSWFRPIAKAATAIGLYMLSKTSFMKNIPFLTPAVFGAGVGIFGSMVSDFVISKIPNAANADAAQEAAQKLAGQIYVGQGGSAVNSEIDMGVYA